MCYWACRPSGKSNSDNRMLKIGAFIYLRIFCEIQYLCEKLTIEFIHMFNMRVCANKHDAPRNCVRHYPTRNAAKRVSISYWMSTGHREILNGVLMLTEPADGYWLYKRILYVHIALTALAKNYSYLYVQSKWATTDLFHSLVRFDEWALSTKNKSSGKATLNSINVTPLAHTVTSPYADQRPRSYSVHTIPKCQVA